MPELPELPEVHHLHHHAHGDRFGRVIAIVTVLATMAATGVAVLQAKALSNNSHAQAHAQTLAITGLGSRVSSEGSARVQLERFELAESQRARAGQARQQLLFAAPAERAGLEAEIHRWEDVAEETERQSVAIARQDGIEPLEPEGRFGPAEDPIFPLRYLAHSRERPYELEAERQVANREVSYAEGQFAAYAVSFTMLAIATFLFGYSLTPHGHPRRRLFAGAAVTFMVVAVINAAVTALDHPDHPVAEAATAYAAGQIAADSSDAPAAVEHFTRAIELDPDFADAYVGRADAEFLAHSPLALSGGSSVTTADALERVIADERKARDLGIRDPLFNAELGSDLFQLGLRRHDEALLEEAVDLLEQAQESAHQDASISYDLGATLVALGRYDDAEHAFDTAVERTLYLPQEEGGHGEGGGHEAAPELRGDPLSEEEDLAVGLEDLQNVATYGEDPDPDRIAEIKQHLVSEVAAGQVAFEEGGPHGAAEGDHGAAEGDHGAGETEQGAGEEGHGAATTPEEELAQAQEEHATAEEQTAEAKTTAETDHGAAEEAPAEETSAEHRAGEEPPDEAGDGSADTEGTGGEGTQLRGVRVRLSPESTFFVIPEQPGFDSTKDRLSVQWYYQDPDKLGWSLLTEVSSVSEPPLPPGTAGPDYHERAPYLGLTSPAGCLPSGTYRLELYVDNRLAAVKTSRLDNPLVAANLHGLDAGICRPRDWRESEEREAGLLDGFVSPDRRSGAYVFSLTPSLVSTGTRPTSARMGSVLQRVLERFGHLLPAEPVATAEGGPPIDALDNAYVSRYRVGDDRMLAGIGQSRNGQLLMTLVYGPDELFAGGEAQRIFGSLADRT